MMKQFANHSYWTLIFSSNEKGKGKGEKGKGKRNQKSFHSSLITHHFLLFTFYFLLSTLVIAQTPQDAINLAAAHSSFANGLADRPGWTAVAYDTKNLYGIWRVQFYDAEGNDLGWSDISLEKQKVYAWETNFDITESEYAQAEEALLNFAKQDPTVLEMIGNIDERNNMWVGYDGWRETWIMFIDRWPNSVELNIRSRSATPRSLDNLYLAKAYAQDIMSYDDWQSASSSQAVEIAFSTPEIAAAVRGKDWTTSIERLEGNAWKVRFISGDAQLAEADVNMDGGSVMRFNLE
jgi:hypothetical protein